MIVWAFVVSMRSEKWGTFESALLVSGIYSLQIAMDFWCRISIDDGVITQRAFRMPAAYVYERPASSVEALAMRTDKPKVAAILVNPQILLSWPLRLGTRDRHCLLPSRSLSQPLRVALDVRQIFKRAATQCRHRRHREAGHHVGQCEIRAREIAVVAEAIIHLLEQTLGSSVSDAADEALLLPSTL